VTGPGNYMDEIVIRAAPRWAWDAFDDLIDRIQEGDFDPDGDLIVPGDGKVPDMVARLWLAGAAMLLASGRDDTGPVSPADAKAFATRED